MPVKIITERRQRLNKDKADFNTTGLHERTDKGLDIIRNEFLL